MCLIHVGAAAMLKRFSVQQRLDDIESVSDDCQY